MTNIEIVEKYAEAWRQLNAEIISPLLDETFTYSSCWVFESLNRRRYLEYLEGKFKAIKSSNSAPKVAIGYDNLMCPCVILQQGSNEPVCITVKINEGKITEGYMIPYSLLL